MTDTEILQSYVNILPFLAQILGPGCEICIHDVQNPEVSLIAIENSITGRCVGDSMTDLAYEMIEKGLYREADSICNYQGLSKGKPFRSSTYFIKNEGRLLGLLCVNKDMTAANQMMASMQNVLETFNLAAPENDRFSESLESPVSKILHQMVSDAVTHTGITPDRMTMDEKVALVHKLNEQGVLTMKGAIKEIAQELHISEPTVYRYLNRKK